MIDIKEWLQGECDRIAEKDFQIEFYELDNETQYRIALKAQDKWADKIADMIDNAIRKTTDICYGCLDYTIRCGKYPCRKIDIETKNPLHYKCIRCCEYLNHDNNCPCNEVSERLKK